MGKNSIEKKVGLYFERMYSDESMENYFASEKGHWRIIGGILLDYDRRKNIEQEIVHGEFIDAVIYALSQPNFYGECCSSDDPNNQNHGRVERVEILDLEKISSD